MIGYTVPGMSWRRIPVRGLAIVVVAGMALTATPAPAATPSEVKRSNQVFTIVNNVRANHDLVKLKKNPCLQRFANKRAEYLANTQNTSLPHSNLPTIQQKCGVGWVGENLVYGPFGSKQMVNKWMNSPGHRANILHRPFRITGVAARRGGGYWWVAQVFGRKG